MEVAPKDSGVHVEAVRAEILDAKELEVVRRSADNLLEMAKSGGSSVRSIGEALWPAFFLESNGPSTIELALVPLSRLGVAQGFSGNHVTIGYFMDTSPGRTILPSRPMVVKVSPPSKAAKLVEEADRAEKVRLCVAYNPGAFAMPIYSDSIDGYGVLWSPFSSTTPILEAYGRERGSRLNLGIDDLWSHLKTDGPSTDPPRLTVQHLCGVVSDTFHLMKPLHLRGGTYVSDDRQIVVEYANYLRGFSVWGEKWESIWAPATQKEFLLGGSNRINPLWVFDQLNHDGKTNLTCGAIHGDLHPRNIMLSGRGVPHIIDFGWSEDLAHIAKDFVLLECNLRFMLLRPDVPHNDVEGLANWIAIGAAPPTLSNVHCNERIKLIEKLRFAAKETFPAATDWDKEYVIPLFLVSLGLLKFLHDAQNQSSATLTILALADYIAKILKPSPKGAL